MQRESLHPWSVGHVAVARLLFGDLDSPTHTTPTHWYGETKHKLLYVIVRWLKTHTLPHTHEKTHTGALTHLKQPHELTCCCVRRIPLHTWRRLLQHSCPCRQLLLCPKHPFLTIPPRTLPPDPFHTVRPLNPVQIKSDIRATLNEY